MNSSQIDCFLAIAQYMSVSRAAEELYLAQSAVSRQIRRLEEELNVALFTRRGNKLSFTDGGREFYDFFLKNRNELKMLTKLYGTNEEKPLRWIQYAAFPVWDISEQLHGNAAALQLRHPDWNLTMKFCGASEILSNLRQGKVDAVFHLGSAMKDVPGIESHQLSHIPNILVFSQNHPLAGEKGLSVTSFSDEPFLFTVDETLTKAVMIERIQKLGLAYGFLPCWQEVPDIDSLNLMLESGHGVALMDELSRYLTNRLLRCLPTCIYDTAVLAVSSASRNPTLPGFIRETVGYFEKTGMQQRRRI